MSYCIYELKLAEQSSIEHLKIIRNECRLFMTNNTNIISEKEQNEWFRTLKPNVKPYVFYMNSDPIGYALTITNNNITVISGGLSDKLRNYGIGKELFTNIIRVCETNIIQLEVLKTNQRAIKTYSSLGFTIIGENENIFYMEYVR